MPSEIEKIGHQPPYTPPTQLPPIEQVSAALARDVSALRDSIMAYQAQLHRELIDGFSELSACVNTLFDRFNRLPILPEITTPTTNTVAFTNEGSGVVSIDVGQKWLMRGNLVIDTDDFSTTQRQFTTASSKTYHVRWDATNGIRYIDTTDATYNPGALAENDDAFASTPTDILLQKIVTDGSNVPTFTAVLNRGHYTAMDSSESNVKLENTLSGGNLELNTTGAGQIHLTPGSSGAAIVNSTTLQLAGSAPIISTNDNDAGTDTAITGEIQFGRAGTTAGRVGFLSALDLHMDLTNALTGGDLRLNTVTGEVISNSDIVIIHDLIPRMILRDSGTSTDTAVQGLFEIHDQDSNVMMWIGYANIANGDLDVRNFVSGGNVEITTTGTGHIILDSANGFVELSPGGPRIRWGSGVPSASDPNGSTFHRTDGTGPNWYVRENAAWVAK